MLAISRCVAGAIAAKPRLAFGFSSDGSSEGAMVAAWGVTLGVLFIVLTDSGVHSFCNS